MNDVVNFCCGINYLIEPQILKCSLSELNNTFCQIRKGEYYYCFKEEEDNEEFLICRTCYDNKRSDILISTDPVRYINKRQLSTHRNNLLLQELTVDCSVCNKKFHSACVFHLDTSDDPYICDECRSPSKPRSPLITSKWLPKTDLSDKIEFNVQKMLERELNTELHSYSNYRVNIRVAADSDLQFPLNDALVDKFSYNGSPNLTYRSKAILAFQNTDGLDTLLFAMYVHEYGDNCIPQNQRRVYIAYLDSVNYFQPKHLRTQIYQEIIISYLDDARNRGFKYGHIWACPPNTGEDYIFHRHPNDQKTPKAARLIAWYKKLLNLAMERSAIAGWQSLYEYLLLNNKTEVHHIPLFEGDYWPPAINDILQTSVKERKKKKSVLEIAKQFDYSFLVVILQDQNNYIGDERRETRCGLRCTDLISRRDNFIMFCREEMMEFSSLRRAKLATLKLLEELKRENERESYYCDNCSKTDFTERFSCPVCVEYDLCRSCYERGVHRHHKMQLFIKSESPHLLLHDVLSLLEHALRCRCCLQADCASMKGLIVHATVCQKRSKSCSLCAMFTALMVHHAHYCTRKDGRCGIIYCQEKKRKDMRRAAHLQMKRAMENQNRYEQARHQQKQEQRNYYWNQQSQHQHYLEGVTSSPSSNSCTSSVSGSISPLQPSVPDEINGENDLQLQEQFLLKLGEIKRMAQGRKEIFVQLMRDLAVQQPKLIPYMNGKKKCVISNKCTNGGNSNNSEDCSDNSSNHGSGGMKKRGRTESSSTTTGYHSDNSSNCSIYAYDGNNHLCVPKRIRLENIERNDTNSNNNNNNTMEANNCTFISRNSNLRMKTTKLIGGIVYNSNVDDYIQIKQDKIIPQSNSSTKNNKSNTNNNVKPSTGSNKVFQVKVHPDQMPTVLKSHLQAGITNPLRMLKPIAFSNTAHTICTNTATQKKRITITSDYCNNGNRDADKSKADNSAANNTK